MKLKIKYVKDHGDKKKERIVLKASDAINVGNYMIADTTYMDKEIVSNHLRHTFWIPDKNVNKGDLIVIYTKDGEDSTSKNESGNSTHFFYWGLDLTIWNIEKDAATLFYIGNWISKKV